MSELYERSMEKLELDRVLDLLAERACCADAKARCRSLRPNGDLEDVRRALDETTAACTMSQVKGSPSFYDVQDVNASLERADRGGCLSTKELLQIAGVLRCARNAAAYCGDEDADSILKPMFSALTPNKYLEEKITGPRSRTVCKRSFPPPPLPNTCGTLSLPSARIGMWSR